MAVKPRKCRIHPESRRGLYFLVYLWPTKAQMLAHCRAERLHADPRTVAQCSTYSIERFRGGRRQLRPIMGEINFHRGRISTEVLAHEIAHAAQGWARRIGLDLTRRQGRPSLPGRQGVVSDAEERYCYGLGRMVSQANNAMHDWGAYDGG